MKRLLLVGCILASAAPANADAFLPAFWVYGLCRREEVRCLQLLRSAYEHVSNAPGGSYAPISYCVRPRAPDDITLRLDFLHVATLVPDMLNTDIALDRMEAFVLQMVDLCGLRKAER